MAKVTSCTAAQPATVDSQSAAILFITRKWGPAVGGMETYCERLTEELARVRPIEVIALKGQANGLPPGPIALLMFPFTVAKRLMMSRAKPLIVHLGDMAIWPLGLLALFFYPSARLHLSAHGTDVAYGARGGIRGRLYSLYQCLGAYVLRHAKVIANSRATRERVEKLGWRCAAVVPLATDLKSDEVGSVENSTILFAGRVTKRKGCDWFVRNVLPLLPDHVRLSVIGTRWDTREDEALENPRVDFLGPKDQSDLARHYAKAGCVIVPNIELANGEYEGFGLVAPEAASAGGVVLASATGGLLDAVIDEKTGFLIKAGDAQAWANKILEVLAWSEAKRGQFVRGSQAAATCHYNWHRVGTDTLAAYGEGAHV